MNLLPPSFQKWAFAAGSATALLAQAPAPPVRPPAERPKDLSAVEKNTIEIFKRISPAVVSVANKAILRDLIAKGDVFVENFGPGTIERMGFSYDEVKKINPRIIYAQIKGFAPDGPYAEYLSFDNIAQAAGGALSVPVPRRYAKRRGADLRRSQSRTARKAV